ncbi:MAG: hypothetical protein AB7R69_03315 [Candidatus Babeliales bacterium]
MAKSIRKLYIKIFCLGLLVLPNFVHAHNNQELFLQANLAYQQGDFDQALRLYEKINNKGLAVLHNMAHAFYQQGDFVNALLFYKRAQKTADVVLYDELEKSIDDVATKLGVNQQKGSFAWLERFTHYASLFVWQIIFLVLWFLIWGLYYTKKKVLAYFFIVPLGAVASVLCVIYILSGRLAAFVLEDSFLYISPSDKVAQQTALKKGEQVIIREKIDGWYKGEARGIVGWVAEKNLVEI